MEWLDSFAEPPIIFFVMVIFFVVVIFIFALIKSQKRHLERMDKINNHFGPDPDKYKRH